MTTTTMTTTMRTIAVQDRRTLEAVRTMMTSQITAVPVRLARSLTTTDTLSEGAVVYGSLYG
jgi:hypothetical protein